MSYGLQLTTPPACEPVTLTEAKDHLRVTYGDDDLLIQSLISAARQQFEQATYRQLITATYTLTFDRFPAGDRPIRLPRAPLQSVASIVYIDTAGDSQTLATDQYIVSGSRLPGIIRPAYGTTWPKARNQPDAITITFDAGHGDDPDDIDSLIRAALMLIIGQLYEYREELTLAKTHQLPTGAARIIHQYDLGDELLEYGAVGRGDDDDD